MRRKTVDCYLLNNLLDYNYLESIKEQETLIILLIKVSSLPEDQIPDEMHKPPHTLESNSLRQQQQQKWPGLEIAVPMSKLWTARPAMSTGKWLRPMGTNKWRPESC